MQAIVRRLAAAGIGAALAAILIAPSFAADAPASCGQLDVAKRRVLEHADQGVDQLRRYVEITQSVYRLTMRDVVESIDTWRAQARCADQAAAATAHERETLAKAAF